MVQLRERRNLRPARRTSVQRSSKHHARIDGFFAEAHWKRSHQRLAGSLHLALIGQNVVIGDGIQVPLIRCLSVERACAFEGDVVQVFAVNQGGLARVVVLARIQRGVDGRAGLEVEPHAAPQVQLS